MAEQGLARGVARKGFPRRLSVDLHGARYDTARLMQSTVIEGGRPLSGTVRAAGNKNGALPILAATLLTSEEVQLTNVPRIRDVETMVELLVDVGADAEWVGENDVRVCAANVSKTSLDPALCREIGAPFLLTDLLARFGRAVVPPPGGDVIGRRRLDTHIHAFAELGVEIELNGAYELRTEGLKGKRLWLDEASVMGTGERDHGGRPRRGRDGGRPRRL